jgi:cell division protein FtsA
MSKIIGAVEIGTSKAKALVGEVTENGKLSIVGMASRPNEGMRKGEIVDFRKAADAVHASLEEAEKMSGTTVDSVYLAQTGTHLRGQMLFGSASVSSSENRVSASDLDRASKEAKLRQPEEGRSYVHHIRTPMLLDGRPVEDPVGMIGKKVDLGYWSVDGDDQAIRQALHVITNYAGLEVADLILSSIASSTMMAGPDLRRAGVLVIDLGAGVTDLSLYRHGYVAYTGVIPVGGDHLTGDLSMGLRVLEPYAEKLKIEHGKASPDPSDADEDVWIIGNKTIGDRSISRKAISDVIHVRIVELFEIISKELGNLLDPAELSGGVLLTGGGSKLPGIEIVAAKVLGLPVRKATFTPGIDSELATPENATVLGLLHYGLEDHGRPPGQKESDEQSPGFFGKLAGMVGIG